MDQPATASANEQRQATWAEYFAQLRSLGVADVQRNPVRGDVFHDVTIEGFRFRAAVSASGPFIEANTCAHGSCQLGVATINSCVDTAREHGGAPAWQICKYQNQWRINVSGLTDAGRRALACEFGLPLLPIAERKLPHEYLSFYASPAFDALIAWAATHPRKIRRMKANSYLGDWPNAAISGQSCGISHGCFAEEPTIKK